MSETGRGAVLIVGGSPAERERWRKTVADLVADVATADGSDALAALDADTEVLLVDGELTDPGASELVTIARQEGYSFRAALLAPETPETDVVASGFDASLLVPVEPDLLARTVEGLLACRRYDHAIAALYDLASEHATGDDSTTVRERIHEARKEADAALAAVDTIDREALLANSPAAFEDAGE